MLSFYESFQQYDVPKNLKGEVCNNDGDKINSIKNFSKINIFIGPNNSGKSKLIRELIRQKPSLRYGVQNKEALNAIINNFFNTVEKKIRKVYNSANKFCISNSGNGEIIDMEKIEVTKNMFLREIENQGVDSLISYIKEQFIDLANNIQVWTSWYVRDKDAFNVQMNKDFGNFFFDQFKLCKTDAEAAILELNKFEFHSLSKEQLNRIYIPSIRSLRQFAAIVNVKSKTIDEYKFTDEIIVYNGQELPNDIFSLTNAVFSKRQKLIQFEQLLSTEFFESRDVKLTFDSTSSVLLIKIGDEAERPIHELGDGLQMLIILCFPFFLYRSGIVAIEEPELFIHPGLQKTFLRFLISSDVTRDFQILIATHSNHIIDSINNSNLVSLFSVRKKIKDDDTSVEKMPDFVVDNLAFGNQNILNLLGINSTSVYLSNCTIWVEGITDKLYIQKFILEYLKSVNSESKYYICKDFKEGINYSFVLSGGDSIIHWDFSDENEYNDKVGKILARKFCSKSLIIVDNDFGKNLKRKESLAKLLGEDRFIILERPEIENYLPQTVINGAIVGYSSVMKVVGDKNLPIVGEGEFRNKKIGFIIDEMILKEYPGAKKFSDGTDEKSSLKSGDKFIFCNKVLENFTGGDLIPESKKLVEKILDFIISNNHFL